MDLATIIAQKAPFYAGLAIHKSPVIARLLARKVPGNLCSFSYSSNRYPDYMTSLQVGIAQKTEFTSLFAITMALDKATNSTGSLALGLGLAIKYYDDPRFKEAMNLLNDYIDYE
jgi:hypothetical protein